MTVLGRPESVSGPQYAKLRTHGVAVVGVDLSDSQDTLVKILQNVDILVASLPVAALREQIPLARAAKLAGIKRFVPSAYAMIVPPKGIVDVQDIVSICLE